MFTLTGSQLKAIYPSVLKDRENIIAAALVDICPRYGIGQPTIFHEFIANVLHESGGFNITVENLNYRESALIDLFGRHRISLEDCKKYGRNNEHPANQQMIGNILYGGEWGRVNLGNTLHGDGYLFRGRSFMQLTGRYSYTAFCKFYNRLMGTNYTTEQIATLLETDLAIGIHSACWEFAIEKKLIQAAINDDIKRTRKAINGGYIGMDKVEAIYELAKRIVV